MFATGCSSLSFSTDNPAPPTLNDPLNLHTHTHTFKVQVKSKAKDTYTEQHQTNPTAPCYASYKIHI